MREFRIVVTPFCNYNCFFCHNEGAEECNDFLLRPDDYEFICRVAKERLGWNTITITGGEPLISPIFTVVCEKLKALGISITVVSNASLLARPQEQLKNVSQLNVSLHTMNPAVYRQITQVKYPLHNIVSTIIATRACLPKLIIHINYTVIKGINDSDNDLEAALRFGEHVRAQVKFIDLSSEDKALVTNAEDIVRRLKNLGFTIVSLNDWQYFLERDTTKTTVVKCPFNNRYLDAPARDVFVNFNGVLYTSYGGYFSINALNDIKLRDENKLLQKIKVLLPEQG